MRPLERVLEALAGVEAHEGYHLALCPAHEDRDPSLSVRETDDGKVLLNCFAGCELGDVVGAAGLELRDLFPDEPEPAGRAAATRERTRSARRSAHDIRDAAGELVAVHEREDFPNGRKRFFWRTPDGRTGLGGARTSSLPLYGTERVPTWPASAPIVVVEGEKAADALRAAKIRALGTVTGSKSAPDETALGALAGRKVVLWPDADAGGEEHMKKVADALQRAGAEEVRLYSWADAPPKGDAADHPAVASGDDDALVLLRAELAAAPIAGRKKARPRGVLLSEVEQEEVVWLWEGRIPRGKITVLDGDPGLGKSAFTTDLAARVSVGRNFPDGSECPKGGVVLLNAEDGLADTIRPRLDAAGGDPSKVLALAEIPDEDRPDQDRVLSLPEDLGVLEEGIRRVGAVLVVIDPLMAFLGGDTNAHKDQDIRRALASLKSLAERTGAAVLLVRHLNKGASGNPLYRGGGSIGIIGAARSGLLVASDPNDPEEKRRVLAGSKNNLAEMGESVLFEVVTAQNGAARVEWLGQTELGARDLVKAPLDDEEKTALDEASDFLRQELSGGPMAAKTIKKGARENGISEKTLYRAKTALKVKSEKEVFGWTWSLPDNQDGQHDHLDHLGSKTPDLQEDQGGQEGGHQDGQPLTLDHLENGENPAYLSEDGQDGQDGHRINASIGSAAAPDRCRHGEDVDHCFACIEEDLERARGGKE